MNEYCKITREEVNREEFEDEVDLSDED